jgi:hypothetical protein
VTELGKPDPRSAIEAMAEAQKIAFAPFLFQATHTMLDLGILQAVARAKSTGVSARALADELDLSAYGVRLLLDMGRSANILWQREDGNFVIDKVGHFIVNDPMTKANLDFSRHVCYEGLAHLTEAIQTGKPAGLRALGPWPNIYPAVQSLPAEARESWLAFDHHYSNRAFGELLPIIFADGPSHILDIGGNTGNWAMACVKYDANVRVTVMDLPTQIAALRTRVSSEGFDDRVTGIEANFLEGETRIPKGADVIWMSQFLDCFSKAEIVGILQRAADAMVPETRLYILENYKDRQAHEAARFSLDAISLYFTCLANGNSQMYDSQEMKVCVAEAGLVIASEYETNTTGHTMFECRLGAGVTS